jgi:polyisoprenoid-binding protein YceI
MKRLMFVSISFALVSLASAHAAVPAAVQKWALNMEQSTGLVEFDAIGRPSALKIHGKGAAPKGSLAIEAGKASGNLTFDLESLDTGISMRNEHMKKRYLETAKYKQATLAITDLLVPTELQSGDGKAEGVPFQGVLSLHGVQKPVSGVARLERAGDQFKINADFGVKTNDYGIPTPGFAGITMAEDVKVQVQVAAPILVTKQ